MGCELVNTDSHPAISKPYYTIFEKVAPQYIAIGMTYEQFWYGECTMVEAYREADKIKQERLNAEQWWQGAYFYEALCDVAPILHAFAKRGTKPLKYPSEPYILSDEKRREKEEKNRRKRILEHRNKVLGLNKK